MWFRSLFDALTVRPARKPTRRGGHPSEGRPRPGPFCPRLEALDDRCLPSTFTVLNLLDSGPNSLRAEVSAILGVLMGLLLPAILCVLMGLLLPAIQQIRALAARIQCRNNLHQIALAAQAYHETNRAFPPGLNVSPNSVDPNPIYNFPAPYRGPYVGCLAYLLPYMDQESASKRIPGELFRLNTTAGAWAYSYGPFDDQDTNLPPSLVNGTGRGYPDAANTVINTYLCPADTMGSNSDPRLKIIDGAGFNRLSPSGYYPGTKDPHVGRLS